jgi:hypothetical protein
VASVARARIEQSERVDEGPRVDRALYRSIMGRRGAIAAALLQATSLPFLVTAVAIGLELGEFTPETGAALVSAGLLSVIVFPIVSLSLLRTGPPATDDPAVEPSAPRPRRWTRRRRCFPANGRTTQRRATGG